MCWSVTSMLTDVCSQIPASAFPCPAFPAGVCPSQAAFPRLLCLWLLSGFGHSESLAGDTKGKGAGGSPLFPAVSCLLIASFTRKVPRVPVSLGSSSRNPSLFLCLRVVASHSLQFLGCTLPCLASQLFHPLCNHFPQFISFFEICRWSASWLDTNGLVVF